MSGPHIFGDVQSTEHIMEILKVGITSDAKMQARLGYYSASRISLAERLYDDLITLSTYVLADHVGDEEVVRTHRETGEFVGFATWWDHWKATYRGRWWMRWRKWRINYKISELHVDGKVQVDLKQYWAYPRANIAPPEFGEPVRWIQTEAIQQRWGSTEGKRFTTEERA